MSTFDVLVRTLDAVEPHPNADLLEMAVLGGYRAVVGKGQFRAGDAVVYLPEASVLPDDLIQALNLVGRLAGAAKNRIKAVRLRGELSQGIVMAARPEWSVGQSVMEALGVNKYEPPIPVALAGEVYVLETHEAPSFDLENIKAFPAVFESGEPVVLTEKIHGTFVMVGAVPSSLARPLEEGNHREGRAFISSKGLMHKRLGLKHNTVNENNLYLRTARAYGLYEPVLATAEALGEPVFLLGEVFGSGVQDLAYGGRPGTTQFRAFALIVGKTFLDSDALDAWLAQHNVPRVPVLYRGPFNMAVVLEHTRGKESVSGASAHIREGVVVTPLVERFDRSIGGRAALKSVSEDYLLRANGTEFN